MNLRAVGGVAAIWLTLAAATSMAQEARTLKERLSDKASDTQRVNNCRVPADRRGPVPRPGCPTKPHLPSPAAAAASPPGRH